MLLIPCWLLLRLQAYHGKPGFISLKLLFNFSVTLPTRCKYILFFNDLNL